MKLVSVKTDTVKAALLTSKGLLDIKRTAELHGTNISDQMDAIIQNAEMQAQLAALADKDAIFHAEGSYTYAPAVPAPEKILCVGLNYKSHVEEAFENMPKQPVLFSKFSNALAAHNQVIPLPKTASQFDYEAELVIVIGKEASNITRDDALSHVFGYTCGNDLSARDLQFVSGQWLIGKSCDGFGPTGPVIVTADEIGDPQNLAIRCLVNGEIRQSSNTSLMMFDCAEIVSYASRYMTLKPGDMIFTGTPSGVIMGYPERQRVWLKAGDVVEVEIEKIGKLVNTLG